MVGLVPGGAMPGRIKVAVEDDGAGSTINSFATNSATIQGHPGAAGAIAVGAAFFLNTPACGAATPTLEYFSSMGGDPILFDVNGLRLPAAVIRQKPDFVGPDGVNDTFLGFQFAKANPPIVDNSMIAGCMNTASFPNFFGTSAATPHIASIAALFLQANPTLTLTQLYTALSQTALPIGAVPNASAGWGFVQADAAANKIPATVVPAAPTLTLGASSIVLGSSTTLTWTSANNQGCTASGTWSGSELSNSMQNVTPTAVGSYPYTLACTNNAGTSPATTVTLTVTAAVSSGSGHSGGGALGLGSVLCLGAMCMARWRRSMRRRAGALLPGHSRR
jgi:subtilisin family serine protease